MSGPGYLGMDRRARLKNKIEQRTVALMKEYKITHQEAKKIAWEIEKWIREERNCPAS